MAKFVSPSLLSFQFSFILLGSGEERSKLSGLARVAKIVSRTVPLFDFPEKAEAQQLLDQLQVGG